MVESLPTVWADKDDSAMIFLVMEVEVSSEFEYFVTFITQERGFTFIVNFILVTFQLVRTFKTFVAGFTAECVRGLAEFEKIIDDIYILRRGFPILVLLHGMVVKVFSI